MSQLGFKYWFIEPGLKAIVSLVCGACLFVHRLITTIAMLHYRPREKVHAGPRDSGIAGPRARV